MIKTLALVLKKQDLGETDRIITILTPSMGKRRVVARSIRKPLSRLAGHLDTLMVAQLMMTDEQDLPKVTSATVVESFEKIREDLKLLEQSYAVGRIVERLAKEESGQQSLFQLTVDSFARINDDRNWLATWLFFLAGFSKQYGTYISDFNCPICNELVSQGGLYSFSERCLFHNDHAPSSGGTRRLSANSIKLLKLLQRESYETIAKIKIPREEAAQVEEVLLSELIENYTNSRWREYARLA